MQFLKAHGIGGRRKKVPPPELLLG
jgi:hypothetical protein